MFDSFLAAQKTDLVNYRIMSVLKEMPQYGAGVRYNKVNGVFVRELLLLRNVETVNGISEFAESTVIVHTADIPEALYVLVANFLGYLERWEKGIVDNAKDLENLGTISNITVFKHG